jgi:GrpB-like predicted nucleotidyltransferase (UPF0157 family)
VEPDTGAEHRLTERLAAAGVTSAEEDPVASWRKLRDAEGRRATLIDLYRIVAHHRGVLPQELPASERLDLARSVMPSIWPGFEITEGSGRRDPIVLSEYDPSWTDIFERWRARIADALGPIAKRIEHVGSTSVPGLLSKPIVDIQVSVKEPSDEDAYVPELEAIGLQLRSRDELHRYFRPFAGLPRAVHVHVCAEGSPWEREHLLFRDFVRAHPNARDSYARAKRQAREAWGDDSFGYTDAKSDVILDILEWAEHDEATLRVE